MNNNFNQLRKDFFGINPVTVLSKFIKYLSISCKWMVLLLKKQATAKYMILSVSKDKQFGYNIQIIDTNSHKEFFIPLDNIIKDRKLLNKFDNSDVLEIGHLYAKAKFFANNKF